MKIRKIVNGKVQWFGIRKSSKIYESPMLDIKSDTDYVEAYKYRIYNLLHIIRGELPDKTYGIKGIWGKKTKEEIDIEVQEALRRKLNLTVNSYNSIVKSDRTYQCKFTVTTPRGSNISLEVLL